MRSIRPANANVESETARTTGGARLRRPLQSRIFRVVSSSLDSKELIVTCGTKSLNMSARIYESRHRAARFLGHSAETEPLCEGSCGWPSGGGTSSRADHLFGLASCTRVDSPGINRSLCGERSHGALPSLRKKASQESHGRIPASDSLRTLRVTQLSHLEFRDVDRIVLEFRV